MPAIGLGTFGSDSVDADTVATAVRRALALGYRHVDCASVYGNEREVGAAIGEAMSDFAIARDDLWLTSKVWNDSHHAVAASCERTLGDLGVEHLDLYLVHWPFRNHHAPGVDVDARDERSGPYRHEQFMETWGEMERLVERGLVRAIGTSNMTVAKLELVLRDASLAPAANEMELHPHFQQPDLHRYLSDRSIVPIGFSPLGSPGRPERDRTGDDTAPMDDPRLQELARHNDLHPAQLCIRWAIQRGQVPIPFSTTDRNIAANLAAAVAPDLDDETMRSLAALDRDNRLIKGQVFLWKPNQDWRDLWDEDGVVVS